MVDQDIGDARRQMPASSSVSGLRLERRQLLRRDVPWWVVGCAAAAAVALIYFSRPTCVSVLGAPSEMILCVCGAEYRKTGNPEAGIRYADQLRKNKEYEAARAVASELLLSSEYADAWRVLGLVARDNKEEVDDKLVVIALERSRDLNVARGALSSAARAEHALMRSQADAGDFVGALQMAQQCIAHAHAGPERSIEIYCHLGASDVLSTLGYFELAALELDAIEKLQADAPRDFSKHDRFSLMYQQAILHQQIDREPLRLGQHRQAVAKFQTLLQPEWIKHSGDMRMTIELNLAYSLAEVGRFEEAEAQLAILDKLEQEPANALRLKELGARLAFRRGELERAAALNNEIYAKAEEQDQPFDIARMQASIALQRRDYTGAEHWASLAIEHVEKLRSGQPLEVRSWLLSTRREPYELRFVALARAGRTEDAIMALDAWHGRTVADGLARGHALPSDLAQATRLTQQRLHWLPTMSPAPVAAPADRSAVLATLRAIDLLALVIAEGDVWRLTATGGTLAIDNLGPFDGGAPLDNRGLPDCGVPPPNLGPHVSLRDRLGRFAACGTDHVIADDLGQLFLPSRLVQTTSTSLHVLLDGPLGTLPVVALRRGGLPLISYRPVLRVSRLPEVACVPTTPPDHVTVLADASLDPGYTLPAARKETTKIIDTLKLEHRTSVGEGATRAALFAARRTDVLHLGVHADIGDIGGVLKLHDGDVSALEISARRLDPRLVVLSACGSADSSKQDPELAASLSSAFMAGGATHVVATLRKVGDDAASLVTSGGGGSERFERFERVKRFGGFYRFYVDGGMVDPIRALQRAQSELSEFAQDENTAWPYFAVFGHEVCPSSTLTP